MRRTSIEEAVSRLVELGGPGRPSRPMTPRRYTEMWDELSVLLGQALSHATTLREYASDPDVEQELGEIVNSLQRADNRQKRWIR